VNNDHQDEVVEHENQLGTTSLNEAVADEDERIDEEESEIFEREATPTIRIDIQQVFLL